MFEYRDRRVTLIDLSDLLGNETADFEFNKHKIEYMSQERGLEQSKRAVGLDETYWPGGQVWNAETVTLTTHSGTHIDAPLHYGPANNGETRTTDKIPLRWCFGDGVLLDMTHKGRGEGITEEDVRAELARRSGPTISCWCAPTSAGTSRSPATSCCIPGCAARPPSGCSTKGVKLIGIDAWGLDRPNDVMAADAKVGIAQFWESHILGCEKEYCQIEKLANLDQLPRPFGFTVMAFPVNLRGTSAAWSRVVALFEELL